MRPEIRVDIAQDVDYSFVDEGYGGGPRGSGTDSGRCRLCYFGLDLFAIRGCSCSR